MSNREVFINCPFSRDYQDSFRAIVFAVIRSGFFPRCSLESDDGSENRFEKICQIILECKYGIHDISKTAPDADSGLPRFNMPLELGLFLAAKKFGGPSQRQKKCLIFDVSQYRYQQFISDISGQDIHAHNGSTGKLIREVAGWLRSHTDDRKIPGGMSIFREFNQFLTEIPQICEGQDLDPDELTYQDFRVMAANWIVAM